MKAYKINAENKTVIIDDKVKMTAAEQKDIQFYLTAGYTLRHKSEKRAAKAKAKADTLKDADIIEALKNDAEALKKYNEIKKTPAKEGGGFFTAKKWYNKEYLPKKNEAKETAEKK